MGAEDEMVGWRLWLNGHEFQQTLEGQGSLARYSPWGHKELDTTEQLNNEQQQQQLCGEDGNTVNTLIVQ